MSAAKVSGARSTLIRLALAAVAGSAAAWGAAVLIVAAGDPRPQDHHDPLFSYQAPR
ncbi:hypothetical protein [Catenulispora subtropica]|uniref:Secreted protein n=1 Tax=Catenulispora subtropica TaxID=450798 RepID=A0ABP5E1C7_9ACTN